MKNLMFVLSVLVGTFAINANTAHAQSASIMVAYDECTTIGRCAKGAAYSNDAVNLKPQCKAAVLNRTKAAKDVVTTKNSIASAGTQYDQQKAAEAHSKAIARLNQSQVHVTKACYYYEE